jgi:hypothetical protein
MARVKGTEQIAESIEDLAALGQALFNVKDAFKDAFENVIGNLQKSKDVANQLRIGFQQSFGIFEAERGSALLKNLTEYNAKFADLEIKTERLANNFKLLASSLNAYVYTSSEQTLFSFSKMISLNEKLGISTDSSIKVINTLTTQFGRSAEQAELFNRKLLQFATETGQPFNKVFQQFSTSIGEFYTVLDPTKAASQFTAFQQLARGFGGEINEFMAVAKKFNTLEEASNFGAQLNNVLSVVGGSFDTMQASMMSYDDRIKYIIKSVADSRQQIMQMDDISRQAYIQQLQQTTNLRGETIQAILNNQQLVDSVEDLTTGKKFEKMEGISEGRLAQMSQNFTTFQDRANLFMDQYLRVGVRLERYMDVQTRKVREMQTTTLGALNDQLNKSKNISELLQNALSFFSKDNLQKYTTKLEDYVKKSMEETKKAGSAFFGPGGGTVLPTRTPGVVNPPSGVTTIGQLEENVNLTESIQKGITNGIAEATSKIQAKEMKITIDATPQLKALLSATVEEKKPIAALLGGTAGKTGGVK